MGLFHAMKNVCFAEHMCVCVCVGGGGGGGVRKSNALIMPPTLKKLKGHIALGLSVCMCVCMSVRPLQKKIKLQF